MVPPDPPDPPIPLQPAPPSPVPSDLLFLSSDLLNPISSDPSSPTAAPISLIGLSLVTDAMPMVTDASPPLTQTPSVTAHPSTKSILGQGPSSPRPLPQSTAASSNAKAASANEFSWATRAKTTNKYPEVVTNVSISEDGTPRVRVPNEVFERGAKTHSDYIVGIFYGKAPSYGKIWGVLNYLWGKDRRVSIQSLSQNAFLFYIPSPTLRKKILLHELWRVGDSPFYVTEWKSSFSLDPPSLQWAPIWTTIQKVPFDLITDEGIAFMAKPLGKLVDAKPFTKFDSVEIKVIVNLTKPLPQYLEIERDDAQVIRLSIMYPWLPPLCTNCNVLGHKASLCPSGITKKDVSVEENVKQQNTEPGIRDGNKQASSPTSPKIGTKATGNPDFSFKAKGKNVQFTGPVDTIPKPNLKPGVSAQSKEKGSKVWLRKDTTVKLQSSGSMRQDHKPAEVLENRPDTLQIRNPFEVLRLDIGDPEEETDNHKDLTLMNYSHSAILVCNEKGKISPSPTTFSPKKKRNKRSRESGSPSTSGNSKQPLCIEAFTPI